MFSQHKIYCINKIQLTSAVKNFYIKKLISNVNEKESILRLIPFRRRSKGEELSERYISYTEVKSNSFRNLTSVGVTCFLQGKLEERHVFRKTRRAASVHLEKPRESLLDPGTCMDLCQIRDVIVYSSHTRSRRRNCHARGRDSGGSYRIKDALS